VSAVFLSSLASRASLRRADLFRAEQEAQLIRHSHRAHDSHLHLAIYFIYPESVTTRIPLPKRTKKISLGRSMSTPQLARKSKNGGGGEPVWDHEASEGAVEEPIPTKLEMNGKDEEELGLSEVDLRAIKKLARRVNVLPVIFDSSPLSLLLAFADSLASLVPGRRRSSPSFPALLTAPHSPSQPLTRSSLAPTLSLPGVSETLKWPSSEISTEQVSASVSSLLPPPPPLSSMSRPPRKISLQLAAGLQSPSPLPLLTLLYLKLTLHCRTQSSSPPPAPKARTSQPHSMTHLNPLSMLKIPIPFLLNPSSSSVSARRTTSKRLVDDEEQEDEEGETEIETPSYEGLLPFALVAPERLGGAGGEEEWVREFK
jgi:hypothetical protein